MMEAESISDKPWQLWGEIASNKRPENSLLQEDLDFEHTTRPGTHQGCSLESQPLGQVRSRVVHSSPSYSAMYAAGLFTRVPATRPGTQQGCSLESQPLGQVRSRVVHSSPSYSARYAAGLFTRVPATRPGTQQGCSLESQSLDSQSSR